ncbi:FAD-binding oxidoreductase [sulfur-oxidizing endosymbiont of Gigantopelta aegis]|uniref:FAD-binding oxidoreductase n=1 Tax=sulfur-oxidizing endosymbiont of Gigantopelta aegis TaxID=2794934 RepID=UPI0018DC75DC|nr:FAD-binding oxidoreductase [sulfur-oxidizing endosymbiont of Gigantopelta aegis]
MAEISYQGVKYAQLQDETVLETLLRNNINVANSCRAGACHICLMHCVKGEVNESAQKDLKPTQKRLNHFLACQCQPEQDIEVALPDDEDVFVSAHLVEKEQLSPMVWRFRFETPVPMFYHAGQFINVKNPASDIRSYSLASLPSEEEFLELQVRNVPDGKMSQWLVNELSVGMHLDIEGPNGHCFYSDDAEQSILMLGTGTGLAPLYGIVRDALHQQHKGEIHLYHGAVNIEELYLHDALTALAQAHDNLTYHACVHGVEDLEGISSGHAPDIALANHKSLRAWKIFLCGSAEMVQKVSKLAFLSGASMKDILSDPFTSSGA